MKSGALVCSDNERQRLADTMRLYVGQGRRVSWAALADATGIREGTLRSYVAQGGPEMPWHAISAVFRVLPVQAMNHLLEPMGMVAREAEADAGATLRRALAQSARLVAAGNEALEDGAINHIEAADLTRQAADLLPAIQTLAGGNMH